MTKTCEYCGAPGLPIRWDGERIAKLESEKERLVEHLGALEEAKTELSAEAGSLEDQLRELEEQLDAARSENSLLREEVRLHEESQIPKVPRAAAERMARLEEQFEELERGHVQLLIQQGTISKSAYDSLFEQLETERTKNEKLSALIIEQEGQYRNERRASREQFEAFRGGVAEWLVSAGYNDLEVEELLVSFTASSPAREPDA